MAHVRIIAPNETPNTKMATILACIRASAFASRPLRPLGSIRFYCDKNDDDEADTPPKGNKLSLDELLLRAKIEKPASPIQLKSVKPPRTAPPRKEPDLDQRTARVAEKAAEELPGDAQQNLDELLGQLREVSRESRENLEDILVGMKIDRSTGASTSPYPPRSALDVDGAAQKALYLEVADRRQRPAPRLDRRREQRSHDLFSESRLGLFQKSSPDSGTEVGSRLPVWDQLHERELKLLVTTSPRNGFEEMIRWTEEGKLWPFPINNELGMIEEANVGFEDHVFLDHLIEDDNAFPAGPVKQFMELVCVGLSKNPYISVERKHKCIEWYRDYFTSKKKLIEASIEM